MGVEPPSQSQPDPSGSSRAGRARQEFRVDTDRIRLRLQHNVAIAVLGGVFLALVWGGVVIVLSVASHPSVLVLIVALCAATAALAVAVVRGRMRLRPFYRLHVPLMSIDDVGLEIAGSSRVPWSHILGVLLVENGGTLGAANATATLVDWSSQMAGASKCRLSVGVRDLSRYLDDRNRPLMRLVAARSEHLVEIDLDLLLRARDLERLLAALRSACQTAGVAFWQLNPSSQAAGARQTMSVGTALDRVR